MVRSMIKKHLQYTLTIFIITLSLLVATKPYRLSTVQATTVATIYVNPPQIEDLTIDDTFSVNITVANVTELAGWAINLYYNPKVVNASSYEEGPFLKDVRSTLGIWVFDWNDNYNATHGHIELACFMVGTGPGANGTGTLATLTFKIKGLGYSPLSLPVDETDLEDSTSPPQPIPHTTKDGLVDTRIHNIAITAVTPSKTTVAKGASVSIYVTVQNAGNFTENFNLTAYCNTTVIATQTVTLTDGASTTKTFTWNTAGFAIGNYTIKSIADQVPGETQTGDNIKDDGIVSVILPKIKITKIAPYKTIVCQGYTVKINVTTLNEGDSPQTFSLTTYYSGNEIETKTITQTPETQTTTFTWNTTGVTKYVSYIISAETAESSLTDGTIIVVYPGDVNVDKKVDMKDIAFIAKAFGSKLGEPLYNPIYDINGDGKIDMKDIAVAAKNFGHTEP